MRQPLSPKKSLGQNFLQDPNMARKIAGSLRASSTDHVVEIGPGMGALSGLLMAAYPVFTAVEIDDRAVAYLDATYPGLDVRQGDVLEASWEALAREKGGPLYVIGNLPYYITSPILFSLLEGRAHLREAVLMMQLEVAQRLVAVPRTKAYGILSVLVQLEAHAELLFRVAPGVFRPKPGVDSAVVRLSFDEAHDPGSGVDRALLRTVVRTAFNQRRKTLRNSLHPWTRTLGIALPHGWDQVRAEELTPEDFVELVHYLQGRL